MSHHFRSPMWETVQSQVQRGCTSSSAWRSAEQKNFLILPCRPLETRNPVDNIFKSYFSDEDHSILRQILEGSVSRKRQIIFHSNGNKLVDAFEKLQRKDAIAKAEMKEIVKWIVDNFKFKYRGEIRPFTEEYVKKIVWDKTKKCKKPIIDITIEESKYKLYRLGKKC